MAKVLLVEPIKESGMKILLEAGLEIVISPSTDSATLIKELNEDVFGIIVRSSTLNADVINAGKNLKIIARHGAGYNNIDVDAATKRNILVTNVPAANTYSVAEYVIAAILTMSRKLVQGDAALRSGKLSQPGKSLPGLVGQYGLGGNDAQGRCLGIIGFGKIGRKTAELATGLLGMKVLAYDPFVKTAPDNVILKTSIQEVLREADFVTLHSLVTKETENLIDEAALHLMKPSAYLINAGRGELIDEVALIEALKQGRIAGATLDVFKEEPPKIDNPLFSAPNLLLTPHIAGVTEEAVQGLSMGSAQAIVDIHHGKKPESIVNPQVWEFWSQSTK